jgi:hypothetical protein
MQLHALYKIFKMPILQGLDRNQISFFHSKMSLQHIMKYDSLLLLWIN